jgi:transcriptional regulator with XRE-family HTH domain
MKSKKELPKAVSYGDRETMLKAIGEKMKETRKAKGFRNYETFAYENDLPRAQYGRYERGSDLKLSNLLKVLDALDVSLEDFFKGL